MPVLHMVTVFSTSSVHAAATMALVDAMAGMMFFTTPCVSWYVTPCAARIGPSGHKQDMQQPLCLRPQPRQKNVLELCKRPVALQLLSNTDQWMSNCSSVGLDSETGPGAE